MTPRRYILIFHQAALGDFIMTWPLAMALGRVFAQSRVVYVTGPDKGRLAEEVVGVEWAGVEGGWHTLHVPFDAATPAAVAAAGDPVGRMLRATQCVVLFAAGDEATFVDNVRRIAGDIPVLVVRPNPPAGVHVAEHQAAQLDAHGQLGAYVRQMQTLVRTSGIGPRQRPAGDGILIHPGSGSATKNWPVACYVELAERLTQAGESVRFLIGEVERERFAAADLAALRTAAPVFEPADLPGLKKQIAAATTFVGNDSGPTHLASVLGVPTLALFGPASSVEQWRPMGPRVAVGAFGDTPAAVLENVKALRLPSS